MKKLLSVALVVIMAMSLCVTALAGEVTATLAGGGEVTIDGAVSAEEYGDAASFHGDCGTNWSYNGAYGWDCWSGAAAVDGQSYDIFLKKDDTYAYVAVRVNKIGGEPTMYNIQPSVEGGLTSNTGTMMTFTLGAYDEETTVPHSDAGKTGEKFGIWRVGKYYDSTNSNVLTKATRCVSSWVTDGAMIDYTLSDTDYNIGYNSVEDSYTWEVRVPLAAAGITSDAKGMVFSTDFSVPNNTNEYPIRYITGTASYSAWDTDWTTAPEINVHSNRVNWADGVGYSVGGEAAPLVFMFDEEENKAPEFYVLDKAQKSGTIKIDGSVSEEEWGKPVMYANPFFVRENIENGLYWEIDGVVKVQQTFKLWLTNDDENIYLALALDNAQNNTVKIEKPEDLWNGAHFAFNFGQYNKDTTVDTFEYKTEHGGDGLIHEIFNGYWLGMVNGQKGQWCVAHGQDRIEIAPENYEVKFDEETSTWIYEVKIPLADTKLNLNSNQDIALSFGIADGNTGSGANRYLVTTGFEESKNMTEGGEECICGIGMHKGGALKFTMFGTPATDDAMNLFVAIGVIVVAAAGVFVAVKAKRRNHN